MKKHYKTGLFKRAVLFITRKKSKSIVLLAILFVLVALVLTGFSIGRATDNAAANLRKTLGGYFKLETNWESAEPGFVTDALVDEIMQNHAIRSYNKMNTFYCMTYDTTLIPGRFTSENDRKAQLSRFLSNTDSSLHEYFYTRTFSIADGKHIAPEDVNTALISRELADMNGLGVGDEITITLSEDNAPPESTAIGNNYTLEIAGIYEINVQRVSDANTAECDLAENFIFTDENTTQQINMDITGNERGIYNSGATFFLHDPQNMDAIVDNVKSADGINEEMFRITINNKAFNDSVLPLAKLNDYINTLILVIIIIGILLLSLVMTMWMRDRLHEIGVYLSIGIRKVSIIGQHILESLLIAVIALIIAWPVSGAISGFVGNYLLDTVSVQEQTQETYQQNDPYSTIALDISNEQSTDALDVQVGGIEFLVVSGFAILIVFASVGLSSIIIVRMKPKDILSSMS